MSKSTNEFAQYCCELLSCVGPCVAKRMFGGYGISVEGLTLAILADLGDGEKLWLKADALSVPLFEQAHSQRFTYQAKGKLMSMNYYSATDEAMESPQQMAPWATLALESALKARQAKPLKKPASSNTSKKKTRLSSKAP